MVLLAPPVSPLSVANFNRMKKLFYALLIFTFCPRPKFSRHNSTIIMGLKAAMRILSWRNSVRCICL